MAILKQNELKDLLEELTSPGSETELVEFKENNTDPKVIGTAISALSNSAKWCGEKFAYLVFGIKDGTHEIVGTSFLPSRHKIGNQPWVMYMAQFLQPYPIMEIHEFTENGSNITLIRIPPNPEFGPVRYDGNAYIRIGASNTPLKNHRAIEKELWSNASSTDYWSTIVKDSLTDKEILEHISFESFPELAEPHEKKKLLVSEAIDFLLEQGDVIIKQGTNQYGITRLGALVLSRNIKEFPSLKSKLVKLFMYPQETNLTKTIEEKGGMGYAPSFNKLVRYIMARLPNNEIIRSAIREEVPIYPEVVIREILANALIHQDFSQPGTPTVEIFSNRIEIKNPGVPIVTPDQFIRECISRNEPLAALMKKVLICEDRGSGIDRVATYIEIFQLPAYSIEKSEFTTTVTIYAPKPFNEMDRVDKIRACYLHCCLNYVQHKKTTNTTVRERFKIDKRSSPIASKIIRETIDDGLIRVEDPENASSKFSSYVPYWAGI